MWKEINKSKSLLKISCFYPGQSLFFNHLRIGTNVKGPPVQTGEPLPIKIQLIGTSPFEHMTIVSST